MINAIAQLATSNYRIGRIFNQSNHSNTAVMHDTRRTQTGTRCSKTNNHSNFQTTANYINHTVTDNYHLNLEKNQTMDNNNNEDTQEPGRYPRDEEGRLKYHWGTSTETPVESEIEIPSRRPPPSPKNLSQPKNPAHTRLSRYKNLETSQSRKSRYATYASTA